MSEAAPFLSTEQLVEIFSLSKTATAIHVGEEAVIQFANDAMLTIWGKGREIIGKTLIGALPELVDQPFADLFARVWREGITISGSDTAASLLIDNELRTFYFDFEYRAVKDSSGQVICVLHSAVDVTERVLAQTAISTVQEKSEMLIREQVLNEQLAAINEELGASNEEMTAINEELSTSREELYKLNTELEGRVADRVRAFAESEERFRTMAEGTDILIAVSDEKGKPFYFNQAWSRLTGRTLQDLLLLGWVDLLHSLDKEKYLNLHKDALAQRIPYSCEFRVLSHQGHYHWLLKKGTPRFLSDGSFTGYISSCVDINQRKADEEHLQNVNEELASSNEELLSLNEELADINERLSASHTELFISEQRFKSLILQAPIGICVIRANDLKVTEVNAGYLDLVGRSREEFENVTIWEVVSETSKKYAPILQEVIDTGIRYVAKEHEITLVRNGVEESLFIDFVYEPVKNLGGNVSSIMAVVTDVTDKVLARRKIEDVEERNRLAIEAAEIGTFELDYETQKLTTSERFNKIFGFDSTATRAEILAIYHPSDTHLSDEAHEKAKTDGKLFYETRLIWHDRTIRWVRVQGNVHFYEDGKRKKLLGTVIDITDYKRLQQQKDDFISIASHELKTPITSLKAALQLLERMKTNPTALMPRLIEQSTRSMQKISELVEDLLNVSRMNQGHVMLNKKKFKIAETIEACCPHIREEGIYELILEGNRDLDVVADEHRIEQVLVNFINNAVKYAPNSRNIYLKVESLSNKVKVSVRDTGPGIVADKIPHLFDRYFRADETGAQVSGLGLGLYISADIISRHDGEIGVESKPGEGSTFWFTLPLEM